MNNEFKNPNIILKNGIYLFVRYVLVMFIAFYTTRLTLQVLGDEDYGINNVIGGLISMFAVVSMPITSALQRFFNVEFSKKEIPPVLVFNTALRIILIIIALMLLLYETLGMFFVKEVIQYPKEREYAVMVIFQLIALMTLFSFAFVPFNAFLFSKENMGIPAAVELFGSFYKLVFLWAIPFVPSDSLILYSLFLLSLYVLQFVFYVFYCNRKYKEIRLIKSSDRALGQNIVKFAGWNSIEAIAGLSITYLSNIIINVFGGVLYNTAYGLGKSLNTAVSSLTTNLVKAVEPQITSSTVVEDDHYRNNLVLTTMKLAVICVGFIVIFFFFSGREFLLLWLGKVPSYAYEFCLVLLVSSMFSSVILPLRSMIIATGKIQWYFISYGIITLVSLLMMWGLLIAGFPIVTAVIMVTACHGSFFIAAIVTSVNVTSLKIKEIIKTIGISIVCLVIDFFIYIIMQLVGANLGLYGEIISMVTSGVMLLIFAYFIAMNESEKMMIKRLINMIKYK